MYKKHGKKKQCATILLLPATEIVIGHCKLIQLETLFSGYSKYCIGGLRYYCLETAREDRELELELDIVLDWLSPRYQESMSLQYYIVITI